MKKIKYIIIGLFLCVLIGGIGLFTIWKDWEFMVKEYFGIGREKVTVTKLKTGRNRYKYIWIVTAKGNG